MSRFILHLMTMGAALILVGALSVSCGGDGCGEGERMFNGTCIPDTSDGDASSDGDSPIILPDGDTPNPDGDTPDGDTTETGLTGTGRCGDPYEYGELPYNTEQVFEGDMDDMAATLNGALCLMDDSPLDGDSDMSLPGMGPEVVLKLTLTVGDKLTLAFGGAGFDALIYIQNQCSNQAGQCMLDIVDAAAEGEQEQIVFEPEFQGDYYIVMDSVSSLASGVWRYALTLENDSVVDGDVDVSDGDEPDGDTTDGDEPDGDATDGDTTDGDTTDGDVIDGDDDGVPVFYPQISATYPIEENVAVSGNMTELYWKIDGTSQLYTMNDSGLVVMNWTGNSFDPPLISATEDAYRGLVFVESLPIYLNLTQRLIQGPSQGDISLPAAFGSQPTGLAYLNGRFFAADGSNKRLYVFTYNSDSSMWENSFWDFPSFGTLASVTTGSGKLWVLSVGDVSSTIQRFDTVSGNVEALYIVENVLLNGISYNTDQGAMWAAHGALRTVVRLNGDFLATSR
jgi:hypothetical protein